MIPMAWRVVRAARQQLVRASGSPFYFEAARATTDACSFFFWSCSRNADARSFFFWSCSRNADARSFSFGAARAMPTLAARGFDHLLPFSPGSSSRRSAAAAITSC